MPDRLVWHPKAREDLLTLYELIGLDNPAAAERLISAVERKVGLLVQYPRMGMRRPDIRPGARVLLEGPYLILYQTDPNTDAGPVARIEIVRIVDARRNLSRLI
jgi:toxin ParE1/3/4